MKTIIRLCAPLAIAASVAGCITTNFGEDLASNTAKVLGVDHVSVEYSEEPRGIGEGMKYRALANGREYDCFTQFGTLSTPTCKPAEPMFDPSRFTPLEKMKRR